ncbi:uncharacterized protein J3D65DRAFT_608832 [Phyllosticta citribraziliensis]|uniref:Glycine N-acyltransferase-like protein n=1 Tax=Phyllosticta citribraziliensis TaxID=989973 RepID=A0ABR1M8L2_9PEZI
MSLPSRYEIRKLGPEHLDWAKAIVAHSNMFHSPVWPVIFPGRKTKRTYALFRSIDYLCRHSISSGLSYGVFDKLYAFKNPDSIPNGGRLYWDERDLEADGVDLLEQMDFPLVSVAMSYDSINPLDKNKMKPLVDILPPYALMYQELELLDRRDARSWKATGPKQVLFRSATATRVEYEAQGLMRTLSQCVMKVAASKGFRGIQIECSHDAVSKAWSSPPAPFKGRVVAKFSTTMYEEMDERGRKINPFYPAKQTMTRVYVAL